MQPAAIAGKALLAAAAAAFAALLGLWLEGGGEVDVPWAPTWELRLHLRLDGLGALYALLATGIGSAVFLYSLAYLPRHLEEQGRSAREALPFFAHMGLFMVAMVGLATAQDLILVFLFWDLTAIASYFLIAYDRHRREARRAALMALLVTGVSATLLLVAALLLRVEFGTFSLPALEERVEPGATLTVAAALMVVAAIAKSAQVPLHFWLPRAMQAPTPVSAYLHSAAMVAAGVLLIGRVYPLIEPSRILLDALVAVGLASIAIGSVLALREDSLKELLAYSTIAQYGYVVFIYGLGGEKAVAAAAFYVIAHAIAKSALFMTVGIVARATGESTLSSLGGLARSMPAVAAASAAAVATLAALPLTMGFFKDELLFAAAKERGTLLALAAVAAAGLTFAYVWRLWARIFLGGRRPHVEPTPALLALPVLALGALAVGGGIWADPVDRLAEAAGEVSSPSGEAEGGATYHPDLRAENVMAFSAYALGLLVLAVRPLRRPVTAAIARAGRRLGPERWYEAGLAALNAASDRIHDIEVRDLRTRIVAVLVPAGLLVVLGLVATPTSGVYAIGAIDADDVELLLALTLMSLAALALTVPRRHVTLVLLLGAVGYSLGIVYALFGAPDVALVAVLVETVFALLFAGAFQLIPGSVLRREAALPTSRRRRWRDPLVALVSGAVSFAIAWSALSGPTGGESVAARHVELADEAHADDVVTAILADFRALDTLAEVSVVGIALLGILALLRRSERA